MSNHQADVTQLLKAWGIGDRSALEELTPRVYVELHRLARGYMRKERDGNTMQATALVNEAFLRLVDVKDVQWQDRAHFFRHQCQHHAPHPGRSRTRQRD